MAAEDYTEPILATNEFNRPEILKGKEAVSQLIIQLILLEPGTYSTRPELGVGLVSRYRNNDKESLKQLEIDIGNQISQFLPEFSDVDVMIELQEDNNLLIDIIADDVRYSMNTNDIIPKAISLSDL